GTRLLARATGVLARAYADDPTATDHAEALLAEVGDDATPLGAYAWYCAGEADLAADRARARRRYERAVELARRTGAAFVTGLAGAAAASIDARDGDPDAAARAFRGLIDHWRRAGMWATQWTMLRAIAGLLARQGKHEDAAVLVGAVRATDAGHRIFGADQAALDELDRLLRAVLGDEAYAAARARGARARRRCRRRARAPGPVTRRRTRHQRGCSVRIPRAALPTSSWVSASFAGWKPPQRTSR